MKIFIGQSACCDLYYQSDYIYSVLSENFEITQNVEEADIIVFPGSCTCTEINIILTLDYIISILKRKKETAKTYLTGCLTKEFKTSRLDKVQNWLNNHIDFIIPHDKPNLLLQKLLPEEFDEKTKNNFGFYEVDDKDTGNMYINTGCLNNCTFCKTTFQKLPLKSAKIDEVKMAIDEYEKKGINRLYIMGTNISQYGLDINNKYMLPEIIEYIEKKNNIKQINLIGFAFKDAIKNDFAYVLKDSKKVKHIGGSLESGSNRVLELMKKGFTVEELIEFTNKINEKYKKSYYFNIIAGFPTENLDDIKDTLNALNVLSPYKVDICRYTNSSFVESNNYPQLSTSEIQEHARIYQKVLTNRKVDNRIVGKGYIYN